MVYGLRTLIGARLWGRLVSSLSIVALIVAGVLAVDWGGGRLSSSASAGTAKPSKAKVSEAFGRLPLRFEANQGQTDRQVKFLSRGPGYTMFLTPTEAVLSLSRERSPAGATKSSGAPRATQGHPRRAVLRTRLLGASAHPQIAGEGRLPGETNYLSGRDASRWKTGVAGFGRVRYRGVYRGVDLVYYGRQGRLEYDFQLAPGADPRAIGLGLRGARRISVARSGDLVISTTAGRVRQLAPVAYQQIGSHRRRIAARYIVKHGNRVGFRLGAYDHARPLVIDPVLAYSTYLGASGRERGAAIAVDSSGSAYVAGSTNSDDFPTAGTPLQPNHNSPFPGCFDRCSDAFVSKLNPQGTALEYSTYLGGAAGEGASGIAVDSGGRAYVTGSASPGDTGFPTTSNAYQPVQGASTDAFLSVLNPQGSGLAYSSFLGGSDFEGGFGVAVDSSGKAYVAGLTGSTDFPTKNAFQATNKGNGDGFVTKIDPDAPSGPASLVASTFLGGGDIDQPTGVAVDGSGVYVTGFTNSTDLPIKNAFQAQSKGNGDAFESKLNPTLSGLVNSTYLGGGGSDFPAGIAADSTGNAYVAGGTGSSDFPTKNPFETSGGGFVTKLDPAGTALSYSSYLKDGAGGIAVDGAGGAYVAGFSSAFTDFPALDPLAPPGVPPDAYVARVKPDGSGLSFATLLGGGADESIGGVGVAADSAGSGYIIGSTDSVDFPTQNPLQPQSAGQGTGDRADAWVVKISPDAPGAPVVTGVLRRSGPAGTSVVVSGHGFTGASAVRFGDAAASSFTVDSDAKITAVAPPHAEGPAAVTVTTAAATSAPNPITRFHYAQGRWDPTGPFDNAASFPHADGATATVLQDGKVLAAGGGGGGGVVALGGGVDLGGGGGPSTDADLYDPDTDTWSPTGPMGTARSFHTATLLASGKVLVTGGGSDSAELYDPSSGTWSPATSMSTARQFDTATLLSNGKVLVTGGVDNNRMTLSSAELYDPGRGTWSSAGALQDARTSHTATLLSGPACDGGSPPQYCGKVLVAGGLGNADQFASDLVTAELYDPATNRWSETAPLGQSRFSHTATALADGRVVAVGGRSGLRSLKSAEIYDPASGSWAPTGILQVQRDSQAAVLLSDGKVLVAGGGAGRRSLLSSAELYDPANGRWGSAGVMTGFKMSGYRFTGAEVPSLWAVLLKNGKALVGGCSDSTELYTPSSPPGPTPDQTTGAGPTSSGLTSTGTAGSDKTAPGVTKYGLTNNPFLVGGGKTPTFGFTAAKKKKHKKGTTFRYTLSEAASVKIVIALRRSGRRRGKRCVAPTRKLRKANKCIRLTTRGTLTRTSHQGANKVAFSGRIGSKALKPGNYQATLTATDAAKNASKPKTITFNPDRAVGA